MTKVVSENNIGRTLQVQGSQLEVNLAGIAIVARSGKLQLEVAENVAEGEVNIGDNYTAMVVNGTKLQLKSGDEVKLEADLSTLIPASLGEKFLQSVRYDASTQSIEFWVADGDGGYDVLRLPVADFVQAFVPAVSHDAGNQLQVRPGGLYVPPASVDGLVLGEDVITPPADPHNWNITKRPQYVNIKGTQLYVEAFTYSAERKSIEHALAIAVGENGYARAILYSNGWTEATFGTDPNSSFYGWSPVLFNNDPQGYSERMAKQQYIVGAVRLSNGDELPLGSLDPDDFLVMEASGVSISPFDVYISISTRCQPQIVTHTDSDGSQFVSRDPVRLSNGNRIIASYVVDGYKLA